MPFRLVIPKDVYSVMVGQALTEQPNECCGLLAGTLEAPKDGDLAVGRVVRRYPLVNAAASPKRYHSEGRDLLDAHKDMRHEVLELLAVYHSHPTSEPVPSRTDQENWWHGPNVVCLIVSLTTTPPTVRGWWMTEQGFHEAEWMIKE
jgi:proteasome lid subunit RPN8/RPN11